MKRLLAALTCLLSLLESCAPPVQPVENRKQSSAYFSVASLIDRQTAALNARRAQVQKIIRADHMPADTLALQVADWQKELQIFKEAELNKPAWQGEYEMIRTEEAVSYRARNFSLPVRLLVVRGSAEQPASVEARLVQSNLFYHTEKNFRLDFRQGVLTRYRIEGFQKTFFSDTVRYSLSAIVR